METIEPLLATVADRAVVKRALLMAIVIGCILAAINHGDKIMLSSMAALDWIKVAITFLVPYSVSTLSSVLAIRDRDAAMRPNLRSAGL